MIRFRHGPDPSKRLQALLALPDDASSRQPLLDAVDDISLDVARAALRRLRPLAGRAETAALRERMLALDIGIVGDIAAVLRELGDAEAATVAVAGLAGKSSFARHKAAVALRELRDPAARDALLHALEDRETPVRRVALEALSALPADAQTITACRQRLHDRDSSVRAAAVHALAALDPDAASTLRPLLRDEHERVRTELAAVAANLDADSVRVLLGDQDPNVRAQALKALTAHPRLELAPVVLAALADVNWHVRRAACDAVAAAGGPGASTALVRALVDPHPSVRGRALVALERLSGSDLDQALEGNLAAAAPPLRRALIEILGRRQRGDIILPFAADPAADVRIAVAHALAHDGSDEARAALRYLSGDDDLAVSHAATTMLEAAAERGA